MKTIKKLNPGQPGTIKLLDKYGEKLVCVRYRYDFEHNRKVKTIEVIVDEFPIQKTIKRIPMNKIMNIQIQYNEEKLRRSVKAAGGKWNKEKKIWELPYKDVLDLGLERRILRKEGKNA